MNKKKIKCDLCGMEVTSNNYDKHMKRHSDNPQSFNATYKLDHDDLNCKFCGKTCKSTNSLTQHEIRCSANPDRKCFDTLTRHSVNHCAWNKGLTADTDARVKANRDSLRRTIANGNYKALRGSLNPSTREEVKQKISATCLRKSKEGTWHTSLAKEHHYSYKGADLHGKWELAYAMYLDDNDVNWIRCKERFPYEFEGKIHYYTPDFYLPDTNEYVEIKGFKRVRDTIKWEQFPEDKQLKVLYGKDLLSLGLNTQL